MILIACPACDRQYDVSHVPAGERVRCICDEVIEVGMQKSMQVRAMHCSHCGGAVEADEANCRWCSAKLTEKDRLRSTLCPQCFTRIETDGRHCKSCGVAIAPQALTPLPEDKACPRCKGELMIRALGVTDVVECGDCAGLWLNAHVFEAVCRDAERRLDTFLLPRTDVVQDDPSASGADAAPQGYIPCLTCREMMLRKNFRHGTRGSGVVVDYCRGHGVWLDKFELERIVEHVKREGGSAAQARAEQGLSGYFDPPVDVDRAKRKAKVRKGSVGRREAAADGYWLVAGFFDMLGMIGSSIFD